MHDRKEYELRLYDRPLAWVATSRDPLGRLVIEDVSFDMSQQHLLPVGIMGDQTRHGVFEWMESRVIPKHRAFANEILSQYGLAQGDTLGIIDVSMALSVTDSYWMVPIDFDGTWDEMNLFDNELDKTLGLIAYTGFSSSQRRKAGLSSEWTTDGTFPKCWRRLDGQLVLFKAGNPLNERSANKDYSPWSEFFASQACRLTGLDHVDYGLEMWKGKAASTCLAFTNQETSLVPLYHLTGTGRLSDNLAILSRAADMTGIDELLERFLDLIVFDSVIANPDRHAGNVAFLRSNRLGSLEGFSPIYDNNMALFPTDMQSDYGHWPERASMMYPRGGDVTFDAILPLITRPRHHEWMRKLASFDFENHENYPVPKDRLAALSELVRVRARLVLDIPPVKDSELRSNIDLISSTSTMDTAEATLIKEIDSLLPDDTIFEGSGGLPQPSHGTLHR